MSTTYQHLDDIMIFPIEHIPHFSDLWALEPGARVGLRSLRGHRVLSLASA